MGIGEVLNNLIFDYTLRTVALGSGTLGIVSGALGAFAVLRKQSLLGDSVSHTALPGIAIAFLLTGAKSPLVMIIGAAVAGWVGTLLVMLIIRTTRIKSDGALGLVLSVFFGFGLVLLTFIQKMPNARQSGLETFLFGQATALMERDVIVMGILGALVILIMLVMWKEFKLLSFDPDYGDTLGFPMRTVEITLTTILVIAIVVGLQTVGVVLMSAMVVAPAAAARQWTDRLGLMIFLSALFGSVAGISGAVISSLTSHMPTGPTIVLCISTIVLVSILLAPNRGILWHWGRRWRSRRQLALNAVLADMYELARVHDDPTHAHPTATIQAMNYRTSGVRHSLKVLEQQGLVHQSRQEEWTLTEKGMVEAEQVIKNLEVKK